VIDVSPPSGLAFDQQYSLSDGGVALLLNVVERR
jgi:hypothetical protein